MHGDRYWGEWGTRLSTTEEVHGITGVPIGMGFARDTVSHLNQYAYHIGIDYLTS